MTQINADALPYACDIIITNYNNARFVERAIESADKQTYQNKSIIVVDDCSTDNSVELIEKKLASIKTPSRFFKTNENGGAAVARNLAIKNSSAMFVSLLDSDDYYYPSKTSVSIMKAIEFPGIGVVYTDYDMDNIETGIKRREFKAPFDSRMLINYCMVSTNALVKREVYDVVGMYQEIPRIPMEDYELWLRASLKYVFIHIPHAEWCYTVHNNGVTSKTKMENWQQMEQQMKYNFMKKNGMI